jgi:hypothetical protein
MNTLASLELPPFAILGRKAVDRVPPEAGFEYGSDLLRPFAVGGAPNGAVLWCITGGGLEVSVPLDEVSGVKNLGSVSIAANGRVGFEVDFRYYKAGFDENPDYKRRVAAQAIGYGVLNDLSHIDEQPTFYLIGQQDGIAKSFSMARITDGPFGDPRDSGFRTRMGICSVAGYR